MGHSRIAQLAERLTVNQNVAGSSPAAGAEYKPQNLNGSEAFSFSGKGRMMKDSPQTVYAD
jgi:hypothetical protein